MSVSYFLETMFCLFHHVSVNFSVQTAHFYRRIATFMKQLPNNHKFFHLAQKVLAILYFFTKRNKHPHIYLLACVHTNTGIYAYVSVQTYILTLANTWMHTHTCRHTYTLTRTDIQEQTSYSRVHIHSHGRYTRAWIQQIISANLTNMSLNINMRAQWHELISKLSFCVFSPRHHWPLVGSDSNLCNKPQENLRNCGVAVGVVSFEQKSVRSRVSWKWETGLLSRGPPSNCTVFYYVTPCNNDNNNNEKNNNNSPPTCECSPSRTFPMQHLHCRSGIRLPTAAPCSHHHDLALQLIQKSTKSLLPTLSQWVARWSASWVSHASCWVDYLIDLIASLLVERTTQIFAFAHLCVLVMFPPQQRMVALALVGCHLS